VETDSREISNKMLKKVLSDDNIIEPIMMMIKTEFVDVNSYSSVEIKESVARCLENRDSFFSSILYFELNHYELYLALEERILSFKQFFFKRASTKPTSVNKKKFHETRFGKLAMHLPLASFLYGYLRTVSKLSNNALARLTGLAIPLCSKAMQNRLKKTVKYFKGNDPLVDWFRRIFDEDVIDYNNSKRFVKNILGRWLVVHKEIEVPAPYFISISPSTACNLRCIGCYAGEYENATLTKNQVNDLLKQTLEMGTQIVCFTGGEPFCYPHFFEVIESNKELFFLVYTNGTHINDETCLRLKELGNVAILMSIEGDKEETDARRGKGVFQQIVDASRLLKENKIMFGYSIMAASTNNETLTDFAFYQKLYNMGAMILWFSTYLPVGNDRDWDLLPTPRQRFALKNALQEVRHTLPLFIIDFENDSSYVGGCAGAGRRVIHVNGKGQIEPCNFFHYYQDTVAEVSLAKAMTSSFFQAVREYQPFCDCGYTPCLFDCNIDALNSILSVGTCKSSYPHNDELWSKGEFIEFSREYRESIQQLYLREAINKFAGAQDEQN
jgi:MoaA/NifB/PqqE/SkfB family radical SAM enzyme